MADSVTIRRLVAAELPVFKSLRDMALELHPEAFTSDAEAEARLRPEDYLPRLGLERPEGGHFTLGAWRGPELLGAIGLEGDLRVKVRHIGHVIGMMVRADMHGRGIGTALVEALVAEARAGRGVEMLTLTVTAGNDRALRLYERAGFARFGTLVDAIRVGDRHHDKIYMAKRL